jgi:RND family efflux transporter MFP subunit
MLSQAGCSGFSPPGGVPCRTRHAAARASVAALLGLLTAGAAWAARPVSTLLAQPAQGAGQQQLDGVLQPVKQATLSAQVGGNVLVLAVKAGDRVRAGQLVARIDERDAQAGVLRSQAGVAQAEAELRNARLNAERTQSLRQQGFVSQAAVDQADTQHQAAQAGLQQAQAGRQQAALARGFAAVSAPFDGVVLATHLEAGDLATPGRPVATLYAPGALRAVVQVPASLAASARQAQSVQVLLADGRRLVPVARQWLPTADAVSQTVEWRLDLPAAAADAASWLPGQAVQVQWQAAVPATPAGQAAPAVPVLPAAAVLQRGELTAVYVVQQQRFVLRAVRTGATRGTGIEVLAGLKPGERVAADAVAAGLADAVPAP